MKGERQMRNKADVLRKIADIMEQLPERRRRLSIDLEAIDGDSVLMMSGNLRDILDYAGEEGEIIEHEIPVAFPYTRQVYIEGIRFYDYYRTEDDAEVAG